ncbi:MAG: GNAT family N-acetyltransferase [Candidatus Latescibacterota bacterium]|nr:MAG: GNAT family N-acetyltransferase [Candidatus Latescibacterota bacterium]
MKEHDVEIEEFRLRDGTRVVVRPILPEDKHRLNEGLQRLSELSRYRRFMTVVHELSEKQLRYLTEIDYVDHMALVALDPEQPGLPGLGVARYVRLPKREVAEVAITVMDSHQGRGLGTLLLGLLSRCASESGVHTFRAYVLADNKPMLKMLLDLGATVQRDEGVLRLDVPVPKEPEALRMTATGRAFKVIAAQMAARKRTRA